jgi:phenylpropionate dioxygenase-like ring-hydroxylating dioxygenase large terminal subunit
MSVTGPTESPSARAALLERDGWPAPSPRTFDEHEWDVLSGYWHAVAWSDEVGDAPLGATLLDEDLVVYRTSQGVVAARDLCLHRGSRLTLGRIHGDELECRYHGWRYGPEGRCSRIPSQPPDRKISPRARLFTYPVKERYGMIWVCLDQEPRHELPDWSQAEDAGYRHFHLPTQEWNTSAARQIENFLDISHFSFVHEGTFGNPDNAEMSEFGVDFDESRLEFDYPYMAVNNDSPLGESDTILRLMRYHVTLPFGARLAIRYPDKGDGCEHVIFNAASPVAAKRMKVFMSFARNFDLDVPLAELVEWESRIVAEDRPIVESQRPEELPLELTRELHVQSDRMTIAFRKALGRLGLGPTYSR